MPALSVPFLTLGGAFLLPRMSWHGAPAFARNSTTLYALAAAAVLVLLLTIRLFRPPAAAIPAETRRLVEAYGWAMVLPQLLAALGGIFAMAGGVSAIVSPNSVLVATTIFCVGMALLTALIGNAFTAFPIVMGGIGIPILVRHLGGDEALSAINLLQAHLPPAMALPC